MLNSHLSHIKIVGDLMTTGKFTDTFAVFCGFDVFVRDKMIHNQGNFILMKYCPAYSAFVHLMDSHRCGDIISQNQIQIGFDELSRFHLGQVLRALRGSSVSLSFPFSYSSCNISVQLSTFSRLLVLAFILVFYHSFCYNENTYLSYLL